MDRRNQVAAGYRSVDPQAVDTGARWPGCGGHGSSSPGLPVDEPALDPRFGAVFGRRAWVLRWDVGGRQGRRGGAEPCVGSACKWCAGRTGSPGRRGTRGLWGSSAGCREWCWARASARPAVRGGFRASSAGLALGRRGTSGGRGPGETRGRGLGERQGDGARGRPGARARGRPWATGPAEAARSAQGPGFPDTCRQSAPAASPATPPGRPTHPALPGHSRAPDRETAGRGARRGETSPSAGTFVLGSMKNPRGRIEIVVAF